MPGKPVENHWTAVPPPLPRQVDGRWKAEQRCRNEEEAVAEARELIDSRHFQSVKVVKEAFDQAAKLYRETTVFSLPNGNGDAGAGDPW